MTANTLSDPKYETKSGFIAKPGVIINEQFELLEYVGKGATARVWRARHILGRYDVALKLLNATKHDFDLGREEFQQLSMLYHPNVVRTFGMQFVDGHDQAFVTMEFIDGRTLDQMIHGDGREEPGDVLLWLGQLLDVLQYLHSVRMIHKDIKPANIVIDELRIEPRAVLIDFNISHLRGPHFGTAAYRCPQVKQIGNWLPYADLWALALTFYEVVSKRELFDSEANFDADLSADVCPIGFPTDVFSALQNILHGKGSDGHGADDYRELFAMRTVLLTHIEIPESVAAEFGVRSRNQQFLANAMLNFDPANPRSKDVILRRAFHSTGISAGAQAMAKLRAVFSQLKSNGVIEYAGKGNKKAVLTENFRAHIERASGQ